MFKVLRELECLCTADNKAVGLEKFKTLAICGHKPTALVNSNGKVIYNQSDFVKECPSLDWLF